VGGREKKKEGFLADSKKKRTGGEETGRLLPQPREIVTGKKATRPAPTTSPKKRALNQIMRLTETGKKKDDRKKSG